MKKVSIIAISLGSGGTEKVISLLLPFLVLDYKVTLVLLINNPHFKIPSEVDVIVMSDKNRLNLFQKLTLFFKQRKMYKDFLKNNPQDFSISFLTRPNFINSSLKKYFLDTKFILSERAYPSIYYSRINYLSIFYRYFVNIYYNKADLLFSNSKMINQNLSESYNIHIPMKVVYNPVILPDLIHTVKKNNLKNFSIVNVGNLKIDKNQKMILDALALMNSKYEVAFIGSDGDHHGGSMSSVLQNLAKKYQISDRVHLMGKIDNVYEEIVKYDCFVLSSLLEGFPNALIEAMACGLPVISTNCLSGPLEILNNGEEANLVEGQFFEANYGILVLENDAVALSKALEFLNSNIEKRIEYSLKARQRSADYATEKIYDSFKKILEN